MISNQELPSELHIVTDKLGSVTLKKGKKLSSGRNNLNDIKWYTYKIENHNILGIDYDCIALSFSRITEEILKEAWKSIVREGVSTAERPNIDGNSGNIHPKNAGNSKIRQLVLCYESGPLTPHFEETEDYYFYSAVHKACYYPLIRDDKRLHKDYRYKFLKEIWKALGDNAELI